MCASSPSALPVSRLKQNNGPVKLTGAYGEALKGYKIFKHNHAFQFKHGGLIPEMHLAYETWGQLNPARSNAIILFTGLSASSHASSHEVRATFSVFVLLTYSPTN